MEESVIIQCPFCWQKFELLVDVSEGSQSCTTDCEICCRPIRVEIQCEDGEVVGVLVDSE